MKQARKRLTYANVMSSIAVFLVLGGGAAFAASNLPKNSVGSAQLKAQAVRSGKVASEAIKTGKLGEEAVTTGKLAPGAVETSRLGDGAVTAAKLGKLTSRVEAKTVPKEGSGHVTARCLEGEVAITGGAGWSSISESQEALVHIVNLYPLAAGAGWAAQMYNGTSEDKEVVVFAICLEA